jgi:hypothetical protein
VVSEEAATADAKSHVEDSIGGDPSGLEEHLGLGGEEVDEGAGEEPLSHEPPEVGPVGGPVIMAPGMESMAAASAAPEPPAEPAPAPEPPPAPEPVTPPVAEPVAPPPSLTLKPPEVKSITETGKPKEEGRDFSIEQEGDTKELKIYRLAWKAAHDNAISVGERMVNGEKDLYEDLKLQTETEDYFRDRILEAEKGKGEK